MPLQREKVSSITMKARTSPDLLKVCSSNINPGFISFTKVSYFQKKNRKEEETFILLFSLHPQETKGIFA